MVKVSMGEKSGGDVLVLIVDTSTPAVTAALALVEGPAVSVLAEQSTVDARAHGELLAPAVAAVLSQTGTKLDEVRAIVAGLGPGPFTGLRVGLVTASVFGQTLGIPTYGVCSLDGIGATTTGATLVATDARRKEVYWAAYRDGVRTDGPHVDRPGALSLHGFDSAAGAGAHQYELDLPLLDLRYPSPLALARVAADRVRDGAPSEQLTPLYLRRPDAVEPGSPKAVLR
jgi:tRNA threonylcarbamoyl adenosine modification protein YeaZ